VNRLEDLSSLKRFLFKSSKSKERKPNEENAAADKENGNQHEPSFDGPQNENNQLKNNNFGAGIMVPVGNGMKVNICDEKYINYAEHSHKAIKDTLVAACSGSTGNIQFVYIAYFQSAVKCNVTFKKLRDGS
jgi:hypothetical protein